MRGRRWLFALLAVGTGLALLEAAARLLPAAREAREPARQFAANPELRSGGERFWTSDARLFWRMRPGLETDFGGLPLRTNGGGFRDRAHPTAPDPGTFTIACLGDSSTFGWALRDEAERFCDRLAARLAPAMTRPVRALNFGQSGYSTHQGLILLRDEVLPLRPQAVVLLFGPNDYGPATVHADHEQPDADPATVEAQSWLVRSALYRRLRRGLLSARASAPAPAATTDFGSEADRLRRVPLDRFRSNLEEMVEQCRAASTTPLLLTYPRRPLNPLLPCAIPAADADADGARWHAAIDAAAAVLGPAVQGVVELSEQEAEAALEIWETLPAAARTDPAHAYGRAYILFRAGRGAEADAILAGLTAQESGAADCSLDLFSTAPFRYHEEPSAAAYAAAIRDLAAHEGVTLVDAEALLRAGQMAIAAPGRNRSPTALLSAWFRTETLFVDVVHPSARGHALLAEALATSLEAATSPAARASPALARE